MSNTNNKKKGRTSSRPRGYDADGARKQRANDEYKIGGQVFHARPSDTEQRAELRKLQSEEELIKIRAEELGKELSEATSETAPGILESIAETDRESETNLYAMAAAMLVDADGNQPAVEFLARELDMRDVAPLMKALHAGPDRTDP